MIAMQIYIIETTEANSKQVLRVGYLPNTGFIDENWNGHYVGYGYEYMESLSTYGNWNFVYVPYKTWKKLGLALQNNEVDIIPCMPGNYRMFPNTTRTDHVVGRFAMGLVINDLNINSNIKIGNLNSNYPVPSLPSIAEMENFSYEMINYDNYYELINAFNNGEVDGYIDAMLYSKRYKNLLAIFDRQSYRLLVRSSDTELLTQLNAAMDNMLLNQPDIRDRLNAKYQNNKSLPLILTRQEREYLTEKKKLIALVKANQKPFTYSEDGQIKGSIVDIVNKIAEDLNVSVEIKETNSIAEVSQLLQNGEADFFADPICDFSWANSFNINLTQPYLEIEYAAVKRQGSTVENPIVACCSKLVYTKSYIEPHFPKDRRLYVDTIEDAFYAVSDGRADILFVPRHQANYLIEATDTYNLIPTPESYFKDSICLGVYNYGDPRLWHILNKEINHLDPAFIQNKINKIQSSNVHFSLKWLIYRHPMKVVFAVALIAALIVSAIWYRNKMRRKHLEIIQHMAYTDARYDLPNLVWLESEMPGLLEKRRLAGAKDKIFVAVLAIERKVAIVSQYGEELLIKHMQSMATQLNKKIWVLMTAAGIDAGHLICICHEMNAEKISELINETMPDYSYIETKDSKIWLHMKAGICEYKLSDYSVRQVVERANVACHEPAKDDVNIFGDKLQEKIILQHKIESHMEKALEDGEFKAWYQPKYDIKTRRIVGAEALVRWQSSDMGFMPPGVFIPLFEKNGFVIPVDYSILEQAFQLQKSRLAAGKEVVPISVNQSRLHMTEEGYLDKIKAIIDKYKISPTGLIELEVTETVFGDFDQNTNQKRAAYIVSKLHEMGFTISVDDFGSGYSSFMMLNYLPMDVMKIDRSLLNASGDSQRMRNILGNVIKLGRTLNMQVICEGIETKEQEELLLELGCHYGQGFLNAKPMPVDDFVAFFEKRNAEVA